MTAEVNLLSLHIIPLTHQMQILCKGCMFLLYMKQLKTKKAELTAAKNAQYEDFCFARSKRKAIQTVSTNVQTMLDQKREASRQVQTEQTQADQSVREQK